MDRGAWQAMARGVTKSQTGLKRLSMPAHMSSGDGCYKTERMVVEGAISRLVAKQGV